MPRTAKATEANFALVITKGNKNILKGAGVQTANQLPVIHFGDEQHCYILDKAEMQKLQQHGFTIGKKQKTEIDGVTAVILTNAPAKNDPNKDLTTFINTGVQQLENQCNSKSVANARREIEEYRGYISRLSQTIRMAEDKAACRDVRTKYAPQLTSEWLAITKLPKVLKVRMLKNGVLSVLTDTIYCVDPRTRKEHELGKFELKINMLRPSLRMYNLTRLMENMHAPHVYKDGHACEGNMQSLLPPLFGSGQYSVIAMLAIQFLESVNTADMIGQNIDWWPLSTRGKDVQQANKVNYVRIKKTAKAKRAKATV